MNFSGVSSLLTAAKELTMAEKGISSAKVVLTGFIVVFAMLLLLILIIKVYSTIVQKAQNGGKKKKKTNVTSTKQTALAPAITQAAAPAPSVQDGVSEEVVAVISAAVATMYGSPEKAKIKSIKKSNGGRSAWANAGVLDNTRPF